MLSSQSVLFAKESCAIAARQRGALAFCVGFAASTSGVAPLLLAAVMVLPFHLVSYDIIPKGREEDSLML